MKIQKWIFDLYYKYIEFGIIEPKMSFRLPSKVCAKACCNFVVCIEGKRTQPVKFAFRPKGLAVLFPVVLCCRGDKLNIFTQSQSATVSFICTISYPVGASDRVLYLTRFFFLSFFFLLATLQRLIASTCFDRFQPDLVIRTPDPWHLCHMTRVGSKVT